jgi:hypothetical protein
MNNTTQNIVSMKSQIKAQFLPNKRDSSRNEEDSKKIDFSSSIISHHDDQEFNDEHCGKSSNRRQI